MAVVESQALILRAMPFSNSSQIIHALTPQGSAHLVAKGSRRANNRFHGPINELSICELAYVPARKHDGLGTLQAASMAGWYPRLAASMPTYLAAEFVREVLLAVPTPPDDSPATLDIATRALSALNAGAAAVPVATVFCAELLALHGLNPELDSCVKTGRKATGKNPVDFSLIESGLLCPEAAAGRGGLVRLSPVALALLRRLFDEESGAAREVREVAGEYALDTWVTGFIVCQRLVENAVNRQLRSAPLLVTEARRAAAAAPRPAAGRPRT